MATIATENIPAAENTAQNSVAALKRKMKQQAGQLSKLAKTSGGKGERIEGIVLKRMPSKPASGSGKPPPTKIVVMVVSPTVTIKAIDQKPGGDNAAKGENYGPVDRAIEQGSVYWYGAFELSNLVTEGSRIVLVNPRADIYKGRLSLAGGAELMKKASIEVLTTLDPVCYQLPTLDNMLHKTNVLIPINVAALEKTVRAFTVGFPEESVYIKRDRNDPDNVLLGAYVPDSKGYPFTVQCGDGGNATTVLVNARLYDNHLVQFGISNVEVWPKLAPLLLETFTGCLVGYVNLDISNGMDINHGQTVEGCDYSYGLTVTASALHVDMATTVAKVGFEVSQEYVFDHFNGENFVESEYGSVNVLNKDKEKGAIVNLSEYTGRLTPYTENPDQWKFYSLLNPLAPNGNYETITDDALEQLRYKTTNAVRDAILSGETVQDPDAPQAKLTFDKTSEYIFAVRQ